MATFAALKTAISERLLDPNGAAVTDAQVGQAVNDAVEFWKDSRFWFNAATSTVLLNTNDPVIAGIPSDFNYEMQSPQDGFVITYSNVRYRLKKVSPQVYDEANVGGVGLPSIYTFRGTQYLTYFYPQQSFTTHLHYIKDYIELTGSSTNDFTVYAPLLIRYEALSNLMLDYRQDEVMADKFRARAEREAAGLRLRTFKQTQTGELAVETILD